MNRRPSARSHSNVIEPGFAPANRFVSRPNADLAPSIGDAKHNPKRPLHEGNRDGFEPSLVQYESGDDGFGRTEVEEMVPFVIDGVVEREHETKRDSPTTKLTPTTDSLI